MVRNTAREIAIHLSYELSFTDKPVEELLDERLTPESFAALAEEDPLYQETPNAKQADYIRRLVRGVADHAPELDGYIAKYAKGWNFARIPLVASAIMRVAMYEILYMPDIPNGAAINEALEIAKKYEKPVLAFSGCVAKEAVACNAEGIDAFFPILRNVVSLDEAMHTDNAMTNMADTAEQVFRALQIFHR